MKVLNLGENFMKFKMSFLFFVTLIGIVAFQISANAFDRVVSVEGHSFGSGHPMDILDKCKADADANCRRMGGVPFREATRLSIAKAPITRLGAFRVLRIGAQLPVGSEFCFSCSFC
jgi:hypothetical protein